ncbi:unnamed protein product [Durusdinium trenchii]|uniref:Acyl-coenzyme A:6-aminopenicillanic acid acyl-transferase n=1 Tax=Durusdinium trenchii TaxID=1381693 RepID=A0ABP0SLN6_9DINO
MADEQLALLSSITCKDVETCRIALARVGWDLNQAAQQLMSEQSSIGRCTCGKEGEGYYGQGSYSQTFFCRACWSQWSFDAEMDQVAEQEGMLQRDLGLLEASQLEFLGAEYFRRLEQRWQEPVKRTGEYFAWTAEGSQAWDALATAARQGVAELSRSEVGMESAARFLAGAAKEAGPQLWKLLTIYEIQVASQLPRRQAREAKPVGCTGVACASGLLGQTEEVDVYIYDYGRRDIVARLQAPGSSALVYDPACTLCPIGIGTSGLAVSRFTLYPRGLAGRPAASRCGRWSGSGVGGLPLAAILWELLLGPRNLPEAIEFLKGLVSQSAPPLAGAAMMLMQPGYGVAMVEWSSEEISVSPIAMEGVLVHANHCILDLRDAENPKIARLLEDSRRRQAVVEGLYAEELLAGKPPILGLNQLQSFLSATGVQNDDVLATVISCPASRALYVRFRLQVTGMERVEDTISCDFWQCFEG